MAEYLNDVPEIVETEVKESLSARSNGLAQLKELGPPDLVHLTKSVSRANSKEVGSYHHVNGTDASSSASLAAYINSLTYAMGQNQQWFGKGQHWRITRGIYCCYNAFSRIDMRVEVKMPGGVEAYAMDEQGHMYDAIPELWQETFLSSILRGLTLADDTYSKTLAQRKINPIPDLQVEKRFIDAAEALFSKGPRVGSPPTVQAPTVTSNYLVQGLMIYFRLSGRWQIAINLFERLCARDPEITSLLAEAYFAADLEIKAVQLAHERLSKQPYDAAVLEAQVDFMLRRDRPDLALKCAQSAVKASPSEFRYWEKLTRVYIALQDYEQALLTLNSCPMFTYFDRDTVRMPYSGKYHFPIPARTDYDMPFDEVDYRNTADVHDPEILKLPAPALRGTFAEAYNLLTELAKNVGWDELLKCRSSVFVMEDEYRPQAEALDDTDVPPKPAPTEAGPTEAAHADEGHVNGTTDEDQPPEITRPVPSPEVVHQPDDSREKKSDDASSGLYNKRLCERWLDNLFMVLYDDLRLYTIWQAEYSHFRAQSLTYRKSAIEWEILGDLSQRLHHLDDAIDAYTQAVTLKFCSRSWKNLIVLLKDRKQLEMALFAIAQLTFSTHRWYQEFSPYLIENMRHIIAEEGALKVKSVIAASNLDRELHSLVDGYFKLAETFQFAGYNM